jgi:hypothetical protein
VSQREANSAVVAVREKCVWQADGKQMSTLSSEYVKSILVRKVDPNKPQLFYDTLSEILDDTTHPAWDEELVCWTIERAWRPRRACFYITQGWGRCIGNREGTLALIMRHRKAIDLVVDIMAKSKAIWIVGRMATFLENMQKLDASVFDDDDCAKMAAAIGRLDETRSSHAKIIKRIQRVCNHILHPKHQNFGEIETMFSSNAPAL